MPNLLAASGIFHPESGGPATYLHSILPALQERGWNARVISFGDSSRSDYPYPVTRIARRAYPLRQMHYALAARKLLAWADVCYLHSIDLPLWSGARVPRLLKVVGDQAWERCQRKGWIPPDMSIDDFQTIEGDWRVRWQRASRTRQVAAMDAVIVPSEYLRRMVSGWGVPSSKIHVIYNALPGLTRPTESRADIRAQLGWNQRPTLLTVARLQTWKGIDHLLAALCDLPEIRLVIVGDGPDLPRLKALAAPLGVRVEFTGKLARDAVSRLMVAADGLVLYSAYEGLSHTLLESLQLGTPVLASDRGGNPELVRHGVNGLLAPHVDVSALREAIKELLERRDELAANANMDMARFGFENMVEQTKNLLESMIE